MIFIKLLIPCSYQGGKQRLAKDIANIFLKENKINENTKFYDLCCGSGAISMELINRGIHPSNITMVDNGCFGEFWNSIANDEFELDIFKQEIDKLPSIKNIKDYLFQMSKKKIDKNLHIYHYLLMQCGSFGSKAIWKKTDDYWCAASFRSYWKPTPTSKRRSPVNPMMPMPDTIKKRMDVIVERCRGLTCLHMDIWDFLEYIRFRNTEDSIFYIDPPYKNTTQYGFIFDWEEWIGELFNETLAPIYVSECQQYSDVAYQLNFKGAKGGISGERKGKNQEWLNVFR